MADQRRAELSARYNTYKNELQSLAQKIGELEGEADEHKLVIETIEPLDPKRKCCRMVGGILVERTVGDVLPVVRANQTGIRTVIEQLLHQYKAREEEFKKFQRDNSIG